MVINRLVMYCFIKVMHPVGEAGQRAVDVSQANILTSFQPTAFVVQPDIDSGSFHRAMMTFVIAMTMAVEEMQAEWSKR
jgi:hypothetical protein